MIDTLGISGGGPYPNYHWSLWITVPTVDKEDIKE